MSNVTVCARFRPLSSKERREHGDSICIESIDSETFTFKDEKEDEFTFSFDRVFYQDSEQADVYQFLALPIVQDSVNAINGTIITYGQTGAGKTYTMEGSSILECDEQKKGLLTRVVDGLFKCIAFSDVMTNYRIKLSMVEIYMEKVRDLFDISKDNLQIKETKTRGILLSGVTEIPVMDPAETLKCLSTGIANRAVGDTQMNTASSRSHCVYMFTVQQESSRDQRIRIGKLILVDLAGSEKVEKTGAEGRLLEEAKTINKSLSALGNVINALTSGLPSKVNHIPYRDSKLSRLLQDALGGNSRTALLCCCSPSPSNASESLSTLRFGTRAKHIKTSVRVNCFEDKYTKNLGPFPPTKEHSPAEAKYKRMIASSPTNYISQMKVGSIDDESCRGIAHSPMKELSQTEDVSRKRILKKLRERLDAEDTNFLEELFVLEGILFDPNSVQDLESACKTVTSEDVSRKRILKKLRERLDAEDVNLLGELFVLEGIFFGPNSVQDLESAYETVTSQTVFSLHQAVEELVYTVEQLKSENKILRARLAAARSVGANISLMQKVSSFLVSWVPSFFRGRMLK